MISHKSNSKCAMIEKIGTRTLKDRSRIILHVAGALCLIILLSSPSASGFGYPIYSRSIKFRTRTISAATTSSTNIPISSEIELSTPIPVTGYDAASILDHYDKRPLEVAWRLNILGLPLLGWYFGLVSDRLLFGEQSDASSSTDRRSEMLQRKRGSELRQHLVNSGSVALIKSGQALSLRPDLLKNRLWSEELGKLVDAVGSFNDITAMNIIRKEFKELTPRLAAVQKSGKVPPRVTRTIGKKSKIETRFQNDPVLNLFDFSNDNRAVASASIGQVYKAKLRRGPLLEAAIGKKEAEYWGGKTVAIKVQRPDAADSVALDMYLLRKAAMWLSKWRGGDLPAIADQFGVQLFGELDYVREANNGERFRALYGGWDDIKVPASCIGLTRRRVLVQEWIDGEKGPWGGDEGLMLVKTGLKCSVDQLLGKFDEYMPSFSDFTFS